MMVIELSVACAVSVAGMWGVERRRVLRRQLQRREQLLTQALGQVQSDLPPVSGRNLSGRGREMDRLLQELELASEMLAAARAAEAGLDSQEARTAVLQAEEDYNEAANAYRGFVLSLAPPLRAAAVERGARVMAISNA